MYLSHHDTVGFIRCNPGRGREWALSRIVLSRLVIWRLRTSSVDFLAQDGGARWGGVTGERSSDWHLSGTHKDHSLPRRRTVVARQQRLHLHPEIGAAIDLELARPRNCSFPRESAGSVGLSDSGSMMGGVRSRSGGAGAGAGTELRRGPS